MNVINFPERKKEASLASKIKPASPDERNETKVVVSLEKFVPKYTSGNEVKEGDVVNSRILFTTTTYEFDTRSNFNVAVCSYLFRLAKFKVVDFKIAKTGDVLVPDGRTDEEMRKFVVLEYDGKDKNKFIIAGENSGQKNLGLKPNQIAILASDLVFVRKKSL